ncbi:MAG: hypothetical protein M1817_006460 [Caeruleum heppii]|nr:MAG: hypothetical protein M1817_006460 [Caeruleum heppii]
MVHNSALESYQRRHPTNADHHPGHCCDRRKSSSNPRDRCLKNIHRNLQKDCNVQLQAFALAVVDTRGDIRTYASPCLGPHEPVIFNHGFRDGLMTGVAEATRKGTSKVDREDSRPVTRGDDSGIGQSSTAPSSTTSSFGPGVPNDGYASQDIMQRFDAEPVARSLKRRRSSMHESKEAQLLESDGEADASDDDDDEDSSGVVDPPVKHAVKLSDADRLDEFYLARLGQMQQINCKLVAKQWIKTIEPKKQSQHPYKLEDAARPAWWPKNLQHKEPDHIKKETRMQLMLAIIRLAKDGRTSIAELEASTAEIRNKFRPESKYTVLGDIYRVAKLEERYLHDELDGKTVVWVADEEPGVEPGNGPGSGESDSSTDRLSIDGGSGAHSRRCIESSRSSLPDETPSNLASPVGQMVLYGREQQVSSRLEKPTEAYPHQDGLSFSHMAHSSSENVRSILQPAGGYQSQYVSPIGMDAPVSHLDTQPMTTMEHQYLSGRNTFASPSSGGPPDLSQRSAQAMPHSNVFNGWHSTPPYQPMLPQYSSSNAPPSFPPPSQAPHSLPPPLDATNHVPQLPQPSRYPDFVGSRLQQPPAYDPHAMAGPLRTGSLGHPHQIPSQGFADLLHDEMGPNRPYGSVGGHEQAHGFPEVGRHDHLSAMGSFRDGQ